MDPNHDRWREDHFSSWSSQILAEIEKNDTYIVEHIQTVDTFRNITCPFQCHLNGDCENGKYYLIPDKT